MTAKEKCVAAGAEGVLLFSDFSYDDALVGLTEDGRAVYDFCKMVDWLITTQGMNKEDAVDWIYCNTIRDLQGAGPFGPVIMHLLD